MSFPSREKIQCTIAPVQAPLVTNLLRGRALEERDGKSLLFFSFFFPPSPSSESNNHTEANVPQIKTEQQRFVVPFSCPSPQQAIWPAGWLR